MLFEKDQRWVAFFNFGGKYFFETQDNVSSLHTLKQLFKNIPSLEILSIFSKQYATVLRGYLEQPVRYSIHTYILENLIT